MSALNMWADSYAALASVQLTKLMKEDFRTHKQLSLQYGATDGVPARNVLIHCDHLLIPIEFPIKLITHISEQNILKGYTMHSEASVQNVCKGATYIGYTELV